MYNLAISLSDNSSMHLISPPFLINLWTSFRRVFSNFVENSSFIMQFCFFLAILHVAFIMLGLFIMDNLFVLSGKKHFV